MTAANPDTPFEFSHEILIDAGFSLEPAIRMPAYYLLRPFPIIFWAQQVRHTRAMVVRSASEGNARVDTPMDDSRMPTVVPQLAIPYVRFFEFVSFV
jgi:hypothetical protein